MHKPHAARQRQNFAHYATINYGWSSPAEKHERVRERGMKRCGNL